MPYKFGEKVSKSFETIEEILEYPFLEIEKRGITKETCETLGIRTGLSTNDGITPVAHYFPVTKNRELVGYIKVDLNKTKKEKGRFTTIGKVNIECDMLGAVNCANKKTLKLFVVEGVYDWPSLYQTLWDLQKIKGQYLPNVVSIPLGTANALESVTNNQQLFSNYKDIILVFDSDKATPREKSQGILKGIDAVEEVVRFFPNYLYVSLTRKDPNEYIAPFEMTGQNPDPRSLFNETLFHAKRYEPDDFIEGPISADELYEPLKEGVAIKCLPKMSQMLHGFRKKELTLLLSPAGTGKTTTLTEIGYDLLKYSNYKVDYIYAEEDVKKAQQRFIAIDNNIRLDKFRLNPGCILLEERERTRTELLGGGRTAWLDTKASFGRLDPDRLIRRLQWSAAKGFDFVFIDHLTMMLYGKHSEVKDIDDLLVRLAEHIVSTEQGIIAVSHITRRNRPAPKGEDGNIKYPHWQEVQKEDARGSGAFEQLGWNIICVEPEILADKQRGRIRFRIDKNREYGTLGLADIVRMDSVTGRLVDAGTDEPSND